MSPDIQFWGWTIPLIHIPQEHTAFRDWPPLYLATFRFTFSYQSPAVHWQLELLGEEKKCNHSVAFEEAFIWLWLIGQLWNFWGEKKKHSLKPANCLYKWKKSIRSPRGDEWSTFSSWMGRGGKKFTFTSLFFKAQINFWLIVTD